MRNNSISLIRVPQFAQLLLGETDFSVAITLQTTENIAHKLKEMAIPENYNAEIFCWNNRWYFKIANLYSYNKMRISDAIYTQAYNTLKFMKIKIREAKIEELKDDIKILKYVG